MGTQRARRFTGTEERPSLHTEYVPPLLPLLVLAAGHTGAHQVGPCVLSLEVPKEIHP